MGRYLITLLLPTGWVPEGALSPDQITAQRRAIQDAQTDVLTRLMRAGATYQPIRMFSTTPQMAVDLADIDLPLLAQWTDRVASVTVDAMAAPSGDLGGRNLSTGLGVGDPLVGTWGQGPSGIGVVDPLVTWGSTTPAPDTSMTLVYATSDPTGLTPTPGGLVTDLLPTIDPTTPIGPPASSALVPTSDAGAQVGAMLGNMVDALGRQLTLMLGGTPAPGASAAPAWGPGTYLVIGLAAYLLLRRR